MVVGFQNCQFNLWMTFHTHNENTPISWCYRLEILLPLSKLKHYSHSCYCYPSPLRAKSPIVIWTVPVFLKTFHMSLVPAILVTNHIVSGQKKCDIASHLLISPSWPSVGRCFTFTLSECHILPLQSLIIPARIPTGNQQPIFNWYKNKTLKTQ